MFGLYSLAVTVTTTIQRLAPPFTNSYFPHFVRLLEQDRPDILVTAYRQVSEFASAIFLAAGLSLIVYAGPIAQLLSPDTDGAAGLALLLALLAAANTLNVEMALPSSLLFAHGITAIALRINLTLCVLYLAALAILVPHYGVNAAAGLWLAANGLMFPALIVMTHRVILPGQAWSWLARAVLLPGCGAGSVLAAGAAVMPDLSRLPALIWIALNGALALAIALLAAPETREIILARFNRHGGGRIECSVEAATKALGELDQDPVGIGNVSRAAARPLHRFVIELQLESEIMDTAHGLVHVVDDKADVIDVNVVRPIDPAPHLEETDVELVLGAEDAPADAVVFAALLLAFDPEQTAIEIDRRIEVANREVHVVNASRHDGCGAFRRAACLGPGCADQIVLNCHGHFLRCEQNLLRSSRVF